MQEKKFHKKNWGNKTPLLLSCFVLIACLLPISCKKTKKGFFLYTTPPQAKILLNDKFIGLTPLFLPKKDLQKIIYASPTPQLSFYKKKFHPYLITLSPNLLQKTLKENSISITLVPISKKISFKIIASPPYPLKNNAKNLYPPLLIRIDEKLLKNPKANFEKELSYGTHKIFIYKSSYDLFSTAFKVTAKSPTTLLFPLAPTYTKNSLTFAAGTQNFEIFWESNLLNIAPLVLKNLPLKPLRFSLKNISENSPKKVDLIITMQATENRIIPAPTFSTTKKTILHLKANFSKSSTKLSLQLSANKNKINFFKEFSLSSHQKILQPPPLHLPPSFNGKTIQFLAKIDNHYPITGAFSIPPTKILPLSFLPHFPNRLTLQKKINLPHPFTKNPYLFIPLKDSFLLFNYINNQLLLYNPLLTLIQKNSKIPFTLLPTFPNLINHINNPKKKTFFKNFLFLLPGKKWIYTFDQLNNTINLLDENLALIKTINNYNYLHVENTTLPLQIANATIVKNFASNQEIVFFIDKNSSRIKSFNPYSRHYDHFPKTKQNPIINPIAVASSENLVFIADRFKKILFIYSINNTLIEKLPLPPEFLQVKPPLFMFASKQNLYLFTKKFVAYFPIKK